MIDVPPGARLVAWGGGVNSTAALVLMHRLGVQPRAIVMSDTGSEWPETYAYIDTLNSWLTAVEWPRITVVSRASEAVYRPRKPIRETLREKCARRKTLPSAAHPRQKKCSVNFKRDPQLWWAERQEWAQTEWAAGRRIVKAIGYDSSELHRVRYTFSDPRENERYTPWYPLVEASFDRAGCKALIREEGLPIPRKSACYFCPFNRLEDWEHLRYAHPHLFADAVRLSRGAENVTSPATGLMSRNPKGMRRLYEWARGDYEGRVANSDPSWWEDRFPCECSL